MLRYCVGFRVVSDVIGSVIGGLRWVRQGVVVVVEVCRKLLVVGIGVCCGGFSAYAFWRGLLQVAATPSEGARRRRGLVRSPRRRSVFDRTIARLIRVQMKHAMSE